MVWTALATVAAAHMRNQQAKKAAARQMSFQEDMSNTAYQRAMADMRKAGLNPILAGKMGGASTPGGATYVPENTATSSASAMQSLASAKQAQANAKSSEILAKLNELDYNYLKKSGLSPMQMKYTAINQASSDIYNQLRDPFMDVLGNIMNPIDSAKRLFKNVENITKDEKNRAIAVDLLKRIKNLGKQTPHYKYGKKVYDYITK